MEEDIEKQNERNKAKKHPCTYEGCTAVFTKNSKLQYHIRRHKGDRPFVCDEPNCNKSYFWSFHLRRHKEHHQKSTPKQKIECPHEGCFLQLANKYSLKKHIKRKHNPERTYKITCNICKQGFFKKRQLQEHSYLHTGILPFKCEQCDSRFPGFREKNRHMRTHTSYSCTCGDTYEKWSHLLSHKKTCTKIKYNCNICGNIPFRNANSLQRHLKIHMLDESEKFYCGYVNCSRFYKLKKNLAHHIKYFHQKATKERVYCGYDDCKQNFTRKQNLILHIERVHTKINCTVKKPRKPRKDKGSHKSDMAAVLAGLDYRTKANSNSSNNKLHAVDSAASISEIFKQQLASAECLKAV